ncbi:MAG: outer membrane protein transport protein [Planctomycetota bacterium]|jgi:long-chain fatty acid transport protein
MGHLRAGVVAGLFFTLLSQPLHAAGFELDEQDVELMSVAFAGRAAASVNASALYWNPASMAGLKAGWNYNAALHAIFVEGTFADTGSTDAAGGAMLGGTNDSSREWGLVPNLYLSKNIGEKWVVGFGFNVPFGLKTSWSPSTTVRYFATDSEITVVNLVPAASYRINKQWSLGVSLNIQHADATLENQIDFGSIGASQGVPGLLPQANDGAFKVSGDSWGVGVSVGAMFELNENHRFGISYRSQVTHDLEGRATYDVPPEAAPLVQATGAFVDTDAKVKLTLPDKIIVSGYHQLHRQWAVAWDFAWTNWSTVDIVKIEYANPNQPTTELDFKWDASVRVAGGVFFTPIEQWTFKLGLAWDQSPIPDETRGPRLPGNDRLWLAAGFTYRINDPGLDDRRLADRGRQPAGRRGGTGGRDQHRVHRDVLNLAIFDIDGTLTRTVGLCDELYAAAIAGVAGVEHVELDWGLHPDATDTGGAAAHFRRETGRDPDESEMRRIHDRFLAALQGLEVGAAPVKGAHDVFERVASWGWDVAIATGNWLSTARVKFAWAGLRWRDVPIGCADDAPERADILRAAIRKAGGDFDRVVYLGDGLHDVRAAREVGVGFIAVTAVRDPEPLRREGAREFLHDFADDDRLRTALQRASTPSR